MIIPLFKLVKVKLKAILFLGLLFGAMVIVLMISPTSKVNLWGYFVFWM